MKISPEDLAVLLDTIADDYTWEELRNRDLMFSILKYYLGLDEPSIQMILLGAVQLKRLNERKKRARPKVRLQ